MAPNLHRSLLLLPLFLIISDFIPVAASPDTVTFDLSRRNATAQSLEPEPLNCTTDFSTDYYGFGVRLGVYFAWLSSYFANTLLPSEIAGSLDTNSIFLLALIASLFKGSLTGQISQIDGLIIMQLSSGFLFSILSIWGYRTSHYQREGPLGIQHFGRFGTHCRLALAVGISMYGTWFWSDGLEDGLMIAPDPQCRELYTWFLRYWPVRGGIHIFYIVITVGCSIYYGIMCLTAVIAGIFKLLRVGWKGNMKFRTGFSVWEYVRPDSRTSINSC
jgi:hypothetical protein